MKYVVLYLTFLIAINASADGITQSADGSYYIICKKHCPEPTKKTLDVSVSVIPTPAVVQPAKQPVVLHQQMQVLFPNKSSVIVKDDLLALQHFASELPKNGLIRVVGHTDAIGSRAYNIKLARRRAKNVMQRLVLDGVNQSQISADSQCCVGNPPPINASARRVDVVWDAGKGGVNEQEQTH